MPSGLDCDVLPDEIDNLEGDQEPADLIEIPVRGESLQYLGKN